MCRHRLHGGWVLNKTCSVRFGSFEHLLALHTQNIKNKMHTNEKLYLRNGE